MHTRTMLMPSALLSVFIGLLCTMGFSGEWKQPDWAMAVLLAMLLSKPQAWTWTVPAMGMHDLFLYWSVWGIFPFTVFSVLLLFYTDQKIGPGQPQRWAVLVIHGCAMWLLGIANVSIFLTLTLTIWLWFVFSSHKEKVYVEPA